jgi:signal transduction histidine kinase
VVARGGTIWFGLFGGGVAHLDPVTRKLRRYRAGADGDGPASDVVRSVAIDADGVVWVGSAGGLDRIDVGADGRVRFVAQHGEAWRGREHVVCLAPVARDELWVGTTTGLVRYRPASGALDRPGVFERLDRAGFAAGACEARDGKVYFGGVEGLTAFAPDRLPAPRPLGPVVLTDFLLFNRPVDVRPGAPLARTLAHASRLSLDHRQNVFGFGFAALDFRDPGGVTYRYRLDGLNDDWIPALPGQRDAVFSGVPAGDYRLRVQAARAGVAARETSLEISMAPPPWRSAWAYAVYAAICALAIGALWRRYHRRLAYERSVAAQIRRSEEALRRLNEELESRVASRTADLVATNDALSGTLDRLRDTQQQLVEAAKLASLGGLVAGVAHEINTPLGVCLTAASHLAESSRTTSDRLARGELTRSQLDEYQRNAGEAADLIVRNLGRADRLVRSFKQTAVDQAVDDVRDVDLEEAVRGALTLLGPLLRGTPHHVVVDCAERVIVRAPPGALYQIVSNLVVNAVQHAFAPDTAGTITIAIARDGAGASICVADDGRGMDDVERSRVFEPFFTTRRGQGGTGLGLHIVYTLVTQVLKGRIDCDSMRERGSRFCVRW